MSSISRFRFPLAGLLIFITLIISGCTPGRVTANDVTKSSPTTTLPVADGLKVVRKQQISSRLIDFTFKTTALNFLVHVDVLLPTNYMADTSKRYPVIYLLHGGSAGPNTGLEYQSWIDSGNAVSLTANLPVICVMPEAGSGGWYTNWYNDNKGGSPQWQTFHINQLVPFIDHTFRTINNRDQRAIVGLSMGGYGSFEYAAQFPDVFSIAASFSGAVDIAYPPNIAGPMAKVIVGKMAEGDGGKATSPFGSFSRDQIIWRGHDPADLVQNLSNTKLLLFSGNGTPGPLDSSATVSDFSTGIEKIVYLATVEMEFQLLKYHISAFTDNYGPGTHSWPYWQRDLQQSLPIIMKDFTDNKAWPLNFTYSSISKSFTQWGYSISFNRKVTEMATLRGLSKTKFQILGSGSADITTPSFFKQGEWYTVTIGSGSKTTKLKEQTITVKADSRRRLTFNVRLGPTDTVTEYSPGWKASDTKEYTATITIK